MKTLIANLLFGVLWMGLTGAPNGWNLLLGLTVGYFVLRATQSTRPRSRYFRKIPETIGFLLFFLRELVMSSLRVAHDVLTRRLYMHPAILAVPLDVTTDAEITLLACLVTLTPGTLTLDVSSDRKTLFVHAMFVDDFDRTRTAIKAGFESRIMRLMR